MQFPMFNPKRKSALEMMLGCGFFLGVLAGFSQRPQR